MTPDVTPADGATASTTDAQPGAASATTSPNAKIKTAYVVKKFLVMWAFFMVVLVGLALIVNIDWAKPYCQTALSQAFHRKVRIGHLTWTFGLNGLEVETTRMAVENKDGTPFLTAGQCQMGVSFVNLLHKRLVISHLSFRKPELWAERVQRNTWNFQDIFELGPDVRYLQFQKGKVHIADKMPHQPNPAPEWQPIDLNDVKLQFVWPHKHKKTPFQLSFKLTKPTYTTSFQMSGLGSGELENWQDNHYKFDIKAEKVNADDFRSFVMAISERINWGQPATDTTGKNVESQDLKGLFNFKVDAEGILSKGLDANISAEGEHLSFGTPVLGMVKANEATTEAKVTLNKKKIQWTDMVTRISNIEIKSRGELVDWQEKDTQYSANLDSNVEDLSKLGKIISLPKTGGSQA
ncbi:MAG TPA: hypothetical protein V6C72_15730, partial [Chroococcales cyanobacterium]